MRVAPTRRGVTLLELIVVLVVGVLAAGAVVAYTHITEQAERAQVQTDLRQIATAVLADAAAEGEPLSRDGVRDVLADLGPVVDGWAAATTGPVTFPP